MLLQLIIIVFFTVLTNRHVECAYHGIHAKHRAFQYWEPALVPMGTYIPLEGIPVVQSKPVDQGNASGPGLLDLPNLVNNLIDAEISNEKAFIAVKKSLPQRIEATKRFMAGIKQLRSMRIPMGIFVPDQPNDGAGAQPTHLFEEEKIEMFSHRRRLTRGMRRVFQKIRFNIQVKQTERDEAMPLDYNATFEGFKVLEAIYVPKGVYVPLAKIPFGKDKPNPFFSGLVPLSIVNLPPGVFIPLNMTSFPDVTPAISTNDTHPCDEYEEFQTVCGNSSATTTAPANITSTITGTNTTESVLQPDNGNKTPAELAFKKWIDEQYQGTAEKVYSKNAEAAWNFETNITMDNEREMISAQRTIDVFVMKVAQAIRNFPFLNMSNPELVRLYLRLSNSGDAILPTDKWEQFNKIKSSMLETYSEAKVCSDTSITVDKIDTCPKNNTWTYNPQIYRVMATSHNPELLLHLWQSWGEATGKAIKPDYLRYLVLKNESSVIDGYPEVGLQWRVPFSEPRYNYSDRAFMREVSQILNKTMPFYQQLHAYVRRKLSIKYPQEKIKPTGPLPAHLLGNMWGQSWRNIFDLVTPYPKKSLPDITMEMRKQNWTVLKMFQAADNFMTGLGLIPMNEDFWANSMFTKPNETEREVVCQATSMDFYNRKNFRTKMCASVTMEDFIQAHTEVTRVEYFMQYKDQYVAFREGANPGFLEAVGSMLTLSIATPTHLRRLKILPTSTSFGKDHSTNINFLLSMALEKLASLPFSYLVDRYRYDVFSSKIPLDKLNSEWWRLVTKYQGICSPVNRTETNFDPANKFHVPGDIPYMQYFVGLILQFQMHKALCDVSGHTGALYTCDIDGSKEAGKLLQNMMSLGSSIPWQDALQIVTGQTSMDAGPMLEYFEELSEWLERENSQTNTYVGWDYDQVCVRDEQIPESSKTTKAQR